MARIDVAHAWQSTELCDLDASPNTLTMQAILGQLIEITFIATFTQRFFAR